MTILLVLPTVAVCSNVVLVVLATALCYVSVLFVTQWCVVVVLNVIIGCDGYNTPTKGNRMLVHIFRVLCLTLRGQ